MDVPVLDSVGFMNLPISAQALFFHLLIRAEWDGVQYRINTPYAHEIKEQLDVTGEDVRALLRNEMILEYDGFIYLENVALYPGPVVCENGVRKVVHIFPGSRLEYSRERVSEYRKRSVFDFENS